MPIYWKGGGEIDRCQCTQNGIVAYGVGKTGLSYECLRQLCINGEIVHMRSGVKYLINLKKLEEYLDVGKGVK